MWVELSEGLFYFGTGGITVLKKIDLRDKPKSFILRTELFAGSVRMATVQETIEEITEKLGGKTV